MIRQEHRKAHGIINGIDAEVWNPATDSMLDFNFSVEDITGKRKTKKNVLNPDLLWFFHRRFCSEKGSRYVPDILEKSYSRNKAENLILSF